MTRLGITLSDWQRCQNAAATLQGLAEKYAELEPPDELREALILNAAGLSLLAAWKAAEAAMESLEAYGRRMEWVDRIPQANHKEAGS